MDINETIRKMSASRSDQKENKTDDRERCNSCNGYIDAIGRCRCFQD